MGPFFFLPPVDSKRWSTSSINPARLKQSFEPTRGIYILPFPLSFVSKWQQSSTHNKQFRKHPTSLFCWLIPADKTILSRCTSHYNSLAVRPPYFHFVGEMPTLDCPLGNERPLRKGPIRRKGRPTTPNHRNTTRSKWAEPKKTQNGPP